MVSITHQATPVNTNGHHPPDEFKTALGLAKALVAKSPPDENGKDHITISAEEWQVMDSLALVESKRLCIRITHAGKDDLMVAADDGRWLNIPNNSHSLARSFITQILLTSPHRQYLWELGLTRETARHWQDVNRKLAEEVYELPRVTPEHFNKSQHRLRPVMPTENGGAWDIIGNEQITAAQLQPMYINCPWQIPRPRMDIQHPLHDPGVALINGMLEHGSPLYSLFEAIAWGMTRTFKGVICYAWDEWNTGKSIIARAAAKALYGAVQHIPSTRTISQNTFTAALLPVATSLVAIYDEADKIPTITPQDLESFVAELIENHLKYENSVRVPATGTGIFLGNDWPKFPWASTGIVGTPENPARSDYAPIRIDELHPKRYNEADYRIIERSQHAIPYLQQLLIKKAHEFATSRYHQFYDAACPETQSRILLGREEMNELHEEAKQAAIGTKGQDFQDAINSIQYTGNELDHAPYDQIKILLGIEPDKPMPRDFTRILKRHKPDTPPEAFKAKSSKGTRYLAGWKITTS